MTAPSTNTGVILTDAAAAKAKALLEQEGREDLALRIAVQPGGCAGLRYQMATRLMSLVVCALSWTR